MIYRCDECGTAWTRFPTAKKVQVLRVPKRTCPDCKKGDRQPRSRRRRKK